MAFSSVLKYSRLVYQEKYGHAKKLWIIPRWMWLWGIPLFVAGFGFFMQNLQLHFATYYYVHKMTQFDLQERPMANPGYDDSNRIPLSSGSTPNDVSFGSVDDPVALMIGYENLKIGFLDTLAVAIPAVFVVTSVLLDNPFTFSRAMFCFAFMEVLKGLVDWMTVVPDSSGWQVCKGRLANSTDLFGSHPHNVEWYAQEHSFTEILMSEIYAPTGRFCSDMMLSGHTQAVTVFGLGLFETVHYKMTSLGFHWKQRTVVGSLIALLVIGQQACEVYFVLKSRFHYSSDILMAIVVSYLIYTSAPMAALATKWQHQGQDPITFQKDSKRIKKKELAKKQIESDQELANEIIKSESSEGSRVKKAVQMYSKHLGNHWLTMFEPRMIQLGCCCTPRAQMYVVDRHDLHSILTTVGNLIKFLRTKAEEDPQDSKLKELILGLNTAEYDADLDHISHYSMTEEVKQVILQSWGLPYRFQVTDQSDAAKPPNQQALLP